MDYTKEVPSWAFPAEYESEHRFSVSDYVKPNTRFGKFLRRNAILFVFLAGLILWTWVTTAIAHHNAVVETTEKLTAEFAIEKAAAVQSVRDEYQAKTFVSGEASKQAAIATNASHLARVGQGVINSYKGADIEDAKKVMLCVVCRVLSGGEFAGVTNIADAAQAEGQWWGYADAYTKDIYEAAKEIATIYENGDAMPCPVDMVYASWNGHEIMLRNQWKADYSARYW